MATGQQLITRAVTALGIIDDGGSISASENAGLLIELNAMRDAWATDNALVFGTYLVTRTLSAGTFAYPIGPTAPQFNTPRPTRIQDAYMEVAGLSTQVDIVSVEKYSGHADPATAGILAEELYYDNLDTLGLATIYLWPVPKCLTTTHLQLLIWAQLAAFDLGTDVALPPGYEDALVYGLAYRCIPRYGAVVNEAVAAVVTGIGKQAKDRIRALNVQNRLLDPSLLAAAQPAPPPAR